MSEQGIKHTFTKGLNKDLVNYLKPTENWSMAKNLINQTQLGEQGVLSTESANLECIKLPYTMIGAIPLDGSQWVVFTTDNVTSEIGIADIDKCGLPDNYVTLINDQAARTAGLPGLNFNQDNLITGASRRNFDCGFSVYWSDGARNPDRLIDTSSQNPNPWVQDCTTVAGCTTCTNTDKVDVDMLRIAPKLVIPCVTLNKSTGSGTLLNGTYQVAIAYATNGIKVTDYLVVSNAQSIFSHNNIAGAVTLTISNTDTRFDEMQVTVVSFTNGQLVAKVLGIFDTRETTIYISQVDQTLRTEDIALIPLQSIAIEKSDSIWNVNNYLLRNGIYERPDFNYQPQANNITTEWVLTSEDEEYYRLGGNHYSYMQDEVYCFFIRFIYDTGDKSASYHIPGRAYDAAIDGGWQTKNTAQVDSYSIGLASGRMGYWESTDIYPADKPDTYGVLCGQPIRHHRFPDPSISNVVTHFEDGKVRPMGVRFTGITRPLDNNGNVITNIVGYEFLRGSREGQKSILAKGMVNNMCAVPLPTTNETILFQNYP
ncbi:MAG: hypothetical protein WCG87_13320 [Bacteroidota bacterium]